MYPEEGHPVICFSKYRIDGKLCLSNLFPSFSIFRCDFYDLHKELVPYAEAWSWQNAIVEEKKALSEKNEDLADSLIVLQHHPVYTLGAGSSEEYLNFDVKNPPVDLYRTERGGEVTYHGPGQVYLFSIHIDIRTAFSFTLLDWLRNPVIN